MGVQGLADGFLAGFNTADQAITRHRELGLRDTMLNQKIKEADRHYGLAQDQAKWRKETDNRDHHYKAQRHDVADKQWEKNHGLAQANQRVASANLGLRSQELTMRQNEWNFQRTQAKRQQRIQEEMPVVQMLYNQIETTGQVDPQLYGQISKDNPLHPSRFFGQEAINTVMGINQLMPKVLAGEVSYNDPQVLKALDTVLAPHIQRNLGEVDPQSGKTIKRKELAHMGLSEDGQFVIVGLNVTYSDGTTADKPMTEFGSSDVNDSQVAKIPVDKLMDQIRGYSQMVGQLNHPERAKFITNMINPPDKAALRQETESYRKALLEIGKDESKQLAILHKDGDIMDEKQLAAARESIHSQAEQRRQQVIQLYGRGEASGEEHAMWQAFSQEYQQKVGTAPDMNNLQDQQFFMQWKQQQQSEREASEVPAKPSKDESSLDGHTAQQLREIYRRVVK